MKYIDLGRTGMQVSRIGLGGYPFGGVNKARNWDPFSKEGQKTAVQTIHTALDLGINYIDTAPGYGDGNSERIVGQALSSRRDECFLATKVGWQGMNEASTQKSVEDSLRRLHSDYVDVVQFHGGMYHQRDFEYIMNAGPMDALLKLKEQGKIRWIGITTEEAWTVLDFLETGLFDVVQVCYNIIYQAASRHLLNQAAEQNIGVAVMRTMTSGILQRLLEMIEPGWIEAANPYEVCMKFVFSDSRVHVANIGMRWPHEVEQNVKFIDAFEPQFDIKELPRMTAGIYESEDQRFLSRDT